MLGPSFSPSMARIPGPTSSQNTSQRLLPPRARCTRNRSRERAMSSRASGSVSVNSICVVVMALSLALRLMSGNHMFL
jgi:anti-sigma-K factor RskA